MGARRTGRAWGRGLRACLGTLGPEFFGQLEAFTCGIESKLVLALPVLVRNEKVAVRNEVFHLHAIAPRIASGQCDIATQGDCILEFGRDVEEADYIAILQLSLDAIGGQRKFLGHARMALVNALDDGPLTGGCGGEAASKCNDIA